jgi:hypothetical protein
MTDPDMDLATPCALPVRVIAASKLAEAIQQNHAEMAALLRQLLAERDALRARVDNAAERIRMLTAALAAKGVTL